MITQIVCILLGIRGGGWPLHVPLEERDLRHLQVLGAWFEGQEDILPRVKSFSAMATMEACYPIVHCGRSEVAGAHAQ